MSNERRRARTEHAAGAGGPAAQTARAAQAVKSVPPARAVNSAQSAKPAASTPSPPTSLAALAGLREALRERELLGAARRKREEASRRAAESERLFFADAVGPVTPLAAPTHRAPDPPSATPQPRQRELDEQAALREAWSDAVDVESLLLTDDGLGFRRPGVASDVLARLRRGQWSIQGQLDLHGLRRDEAREALFAFLGAARRRGWRCLRVVHGKGLGSPGREPVLKAKVQRWLAQSEAVIAFAQASGPQGGAGALLVLLDSAAR